MTLELQVAALAAATTALTEAVNVKKATLDASVQAAEDAADRAEASLSAGPGGVLYVHPESHPADMILQDESHRFVTDAEKTSWNSKPDVDTVRPRLEFQATATHYQWRFEGEQVWQNMFPVSTPSQPSMPPGQYGIFALQSAPNGDAVFSLQ